ncbi:hypothetical protein CTA2_7673 [Colletotrichum tanaceti]|uniref:Cellobiose dehydrogenase-like cytochrome domain-containing protein n=1 Tax=Colletotrichum tanaceti TaxID=1306861 RepID=A0A4U6XPL2_9PEZI|nr:hypothetical protein CTA2_7673 [Colletotrichum tanaceti]TKW57694.1 hypothetical protein CTA1_11543 [Colletotrichum tanaceti]
MMDTQAVPYKRSRARWPLWFVLLQLLLLHTLHAAASPVQYCAVDKRHNVDQCIVASSYRNASSGGNDLRLYLSARFDERRGYAAFGIGSLMDGALMFVLYPGQRAGDVTFSLRTTHFHNPPEVAHDGPSYSVTEAAADGSYHNVGVVCHGCDTWPGSGFSVTSEKQPWVFANNYDWLMQTDDRAKPLTLHTFYDNFHLNMKASYSEQDQEGALPLGLLNDDRTPGFVPSEHGGPSPSGPSRKLSPYVAHGALLAFAFLVSMPTAVVIIRSKHESSFRIHWITQTVSAVAAACGIGLGIYASKLMIEVGYRTLNTPTPLLDPWTLLLQDGTYFSTLQVPSARGSHQIIGLLIAIGLFVAPSLGYFHHDRFVETGRQTAFTTWHRRIGYISMIGGWFNTVL